MKHILSNILIQVLKLRRVQKKINCKGQSSRINIRNGHNMWSSSELVTAHGLLLCVMSAY